MTFIKLVADITGRIMEMSKRDTLEKTNITSYLSFNHIHFLLISPLINLFQLKTC